MDKEVLRQCIVPIDLGFGWTKGKYQQTYFRQPSVVGEAKLLHEQNIREEDIRFNDNLFVGSLAVRHSDMKYPTMSENKASTWTSQILLQTALGVLAPTQDVFLISGLPMDYYFKQKAEFEGFLREFNKKEEYKLRLGMKDPFQAKPTIIKFKTVPQPLGSAMNYLLDDNGEFKDEAEAKKVFVVLDMGFFSFDILVLEDYEIHKYSHTEPDTSIGTAYKLIQDDLRKELGRAPGLHELDRYILEGEYQGVDLVKPAQRAFAALARQMSMVLDSLNMRYHKVIVTGGWADQLATYVKAKEEHKVVMNQFGNIDGYDKIGARACRPSNAA